ncbi:MAG: rhomboid family intramembrane serine protease [Bacteroidales bacterium]
MISAPIQCPCKNRSGQNLACTEFIVNYRTASECPVGMPQVLYSDCLLFGMYVPNSVIYLYFAIPIKAKYFVIGFMVPLNELFSGMLIRHRASNVAHFAHLGGMIFGYFVLMYWKRRR